jgi:hypothetical protein
VGFVFEGFDGAGRSRTTEIYKSPSFPNAAGIPYPVDTRGELVGTDVDGEFESPLELAEALAGSDLVKQCLVLQAFRFYFGQVEPERSIPPIVEGAEALQDSDRLGDLLLAMLSTPTTFLRTR